MNYRNDQALSTHTGIDFKSLHWLTEKFEQMFDKKLPFIDPEGCIVSFNPGLRTSKNSDTGRSFGHVSYMAANLAAKSGPSRLFWNDRSSSQLVPLRQPVMLIKTL